MRQTESTVGRRDMRGRVDLWASARFHQVRTRTGLILGRGQGSPDMSSLPQALVLEAGQTGLRSCDSKRWLRLLVVLTHARSPPTYLLWVVSYTEHF